MDIRETQEKIHETGHAHGEGHHHGEDGNHAKRLALLIAFLAAILAIVEMSGKSAQNSSIIANVEAANLWSFFQAKTVRMTLLQTQAEELQTYLSDTDTSQSAAMKQRIQDWQEAAARYDSEPATGEGRKELAVRAGAAEAKRDHALASYHMFEYGAAALQLAIVLISAAVVTGAMTLAWLGGGLGIVGGIFGSLGWFAPTLLHF